MVDKKIQKIISCCTLIILLSIVLFSYKLFDEYKIMEDSYSKVEVSMNNQVNIILKTALRENIKKAELLMNDNTSMIHTRLLNEYGDNLDELEEDIAIPTPDSKLSKILDDVLTDFYVNEDNSSNKSIVISMNNIIWNRSFVHNNDDSVTSLSDFTNSQYNNILTDRAIEAVLNKNVQKNDFIFWELVPNANSNHDLISDMSMDALYDIYHKEGLEGLKSYELLIPTYITRDGDVFGTSDINSLGQKIENYKIVIIQRLNVHDILKHYSSDLAYCKAQVNAVESESLDTNRHRAFMMSQSLILILFVLIFSAYFQNRLVSKK